MSLIRKVVGNSLLGFLLVVTFLIVLFPVAWTIMSSFKLQVDMFSIPPVWFFKPTLLYYIKIFTDKPIFKSILNSTVIASFTTIISVSVGSIAAYSLARFKFFGSRSLPVVILFGQMIPPITFIIPYFILMRKFALLDTHMAVIITHTCFTLSFVVWLMRSFFISIPRELEEAAIIDGCSQIGAFLRVVVPLAAPGLATTSIFCFLYSWNEFLYALMLTGVKTQTLPVVAASFVTPIGVLWGQLFSLVVIVMSPMLILGILIRKHFVKGLALGAVKG